MSRSKIIIKNYLKSVFKPVSPTVDTHEHEAAIRFGHFVADDHGGNLGPNTKSRFWSKKNSNYDLKKMDFGVFDAAEFIFFGLAMGFERNKKKRFWIFEK